jgi:hypothetical protein
LLRNSRAGIAVADSRGHWLKALGHARGPLPEAWLEDGRATSLRRTGFPRRPRMEPGDRLVYYASVWRRVFALVEVVQPPAETRPGTRWPWTVEVEPLVVIPRLDVAPPVEALGIPARSMSQQSHIRITPEQYARAVDVIGSVAR